MRAMIEGLRSGYPLAAGMPPIYADDDFTQRFLAALDEVLAPVLSVLDNLDAYVDPGTAPADVLEWLAGWVAVGFEEDWPPERRRTLVRHAAALYGIRGTVAGLREQLELMFGERVEVVDSGGTAWSSAPGGPLPGEPAPAVTVRLKGDPAIAPRIAAVAAAAVPAQVRVEVEVLSP